MNRFIQYIIEAVRSPREQLTRGQQQVRYGWELAAHCARQLNRHRAEGMAAELTYRTIFALVPVVLLGLVMFRIVGGLEDVRLRVQNQLYSFFGVPEIPDDYAADYAPEPRDRDDEIEAANTNADFEVMSSDSSNREEASDDPPDSRDAREAASRQPSTEKTSTQGARDQSPGDKQIGSERDDTDPAEPSEDSFAESTASESPQADPQQAAKEFADLTAEEAKRQTRASIRRTLQDVTDKVANIDFASIGVFGLLLFVYAAVALADSVESLFNRIYDAPTNRPVHIRLAIHWSIITLGSGLLAMSLYMSGQVIDYFSSMGAGSTIRPVMTHLLSLGASWVLLFLLYALMPNTYVSVRAAMIGSFVGALLWEAAKFGFQIYVIKAVPYSAIYGSLGLIPLFLFWLYVTWLIVLFGLILTYTLQMLGGRRLSRIDWDDAGVIHGDPDWMLPIMTEVARLFAEGKSIRHQDLADHLGLPSRIVHEMTAKLVDADLLRRTSSGAGDEDELMLARPAECIEIDSILALAHRSRPTNSHPAWQTLAGLKQAERDAAQGRTLADTLQAIN